MFGPNTSKKTSLKVNFHHRERAFMEMYKSTLDLFRKKFNINSDYEIVIFSGSGTLAVESFISHFKGKLDVLTDNYNDEKFAKRWTDIARYYGKHDPNSKHRMYVQFETSQSKYNGERNDVVFTDAISSFPFFPTPQSPVWATVSSKILGGIPVLGILVINKSFLKEYITNDDPSYLNPITYLQSQLKYQTPFTPAIPLFQDLFMSLKKIDVNKIRKNIIENHKTILDAIGQKNVVNPSISPVMTVKEGVIPEKIAKKWQLYGYNTGNKIQIFLYSEKKAKYKALARDISKYLS